VATNVACTGFLDADHPRVNPGLVTEYKRSYQQMFAALAALDELALDPTPDQLRVTYTRLRITRASHESRLVFQKIMSILSESSGSTLARKVELLVQMHVELREASRRHVSTWTRAQTKADWAGYCRSSAELRRRWRQMMDRERQLLHPLLANSVHAGPHETHYTPR